jgi:virulence-associated protein VapD
MYFSTKNDMDKVNALVLKKEIKAILKKQGYQVNKGVFYLKRNGREAKRNVHFVAKAERITSHEGFIIDKVNLVRKYLINGKDLDIDKIEPKIIEVKPNTEWEDLFRWWNIVWWSLPYEHAYGRQMRFIIWDDYHKAPIGLIGLQSPILSWSVRDNHLGISPKKRDYWVNQSLSAQRLGALPPYNSILGGKLVAYLMTTDAIRKRFKIKYENQKTILKNRKLPSRLLFITTTGAYGKSSVYTRLKYGNEYVARFIGYTKGSGSFHISNELFEKLITYLEERGHDVRRGFGSGPSRKLRLIDQALNMLGFENGANHGVQRAVYLFPLVNNLKDVIKENTKPKWVHRNITELTQFWKERWAKPRILKGKSCFEYVGEKFLKNSIEELKNYKNNCRIK